MKVKNTMSSVEQACVFPATHTGHPGWAHRDGDSDCELSKVGESLTFLCLYFYSILKYL